MRNSANVGPKHLTGVFTFHSSPCSVMLNAFFISIRWRTNLSVSLWEFTSFLRIPSVFWNASLVFSLCTANHPSAFCHRGHFPRKVCGGWGRRKGGKPLFCQSCSCYCDSLFSLAQFSQVMLTNPGWNLKAFSVSFSGTALLDPSLPKSIYQVLHQYKVILFCNRCMWIF